MGEYVVIPAQSKGGSSEIQVRRDAQNEALVDDDAVGVATIGDAPEVLIRHVKGECEVRAKLLEADAALIAGSIRVHQATYGGEVPGLELRDCGADFGDAANDFMSRNNRVRGRHEFAPLITHRVEIGVTNAAEQNFDLHVVFGWIAPRDRGGG